MSIFVVLLLAFAILLVILFYKSILPSAIKCFAFSKPSMKIYKDIVRNLLLQSPLVDLSLDEAI